MNRFQDKVALITGAARGIGRGIALQLAREGADIVINDLANMALAEETANEIRALGRQALTWQADVADRAAVSAMMDGVNERFGRLDIAVANAATSVREPTVEADWDNVRRTFEVVQFGTYNLCQMAAQQMIQQPLVGTSRGKIVIIASIMGEMSIPNSAPYAMAKAANMSFAQTLAAELTGARINVNVINPGWIDTPGERSFVTDEEIAALGPHMPWGRLGQPEDIAKAAAFLASDDADYITGSTLRVDGGYMARLSLADIPA